MKKTLRLAVLLLFSATGLLRPASGQTFSLAGQASGWLSLNDSEPSTPRFGFRYLPGLSFSYPLSGTFNLDAEATLNGFVTGEAPGWADLDTDARLKAYRAWIRLSSGQFEIRLGLQKLNFGSAVLLRPLMWFDRIDPRDPLQITDGVTGLLMRYYFLDNTNIWLWTLYGNDDAKGWESFPSRRNSLEFGGRLQIPLPAGELGLTTHRREADLSRGPAGLPNPEDPRVPESRFALDGKWDVGIGLWLETSLSHLRHRMLPYSYTRALTVGADYTLDVGSGLYVLAEQFWYQTADKILGRGEGLEFSAFTARYPLGILDQISAIVFYDWDNRQSYNFINWQRTTDRWTFYVMGFWNPETFGIYRQTGSGNVLAGKGVQVMIVYNH